MAERGTEKVTEWLEIDLTKLTNTDRISLMTEVMDTSAIPAARIKVLCDPIISSVRQPVGCLYPAFEVLF